MEVLDADRRVDAEHALSSVDVTIHSETLRDTAPVLEGIKVKQAHGNTFSRTFTEQIWQLFSFYLLTF